MNHAELLMLAAAALSGGLLTRVLDPLFTKIAKKLWGKEEEERIEKAAELHEADIMSRISYQLREELFEEKKAQDTTILTLRTVIINLTGLLNDVLPKIEGVTAEERERLLQACLDARLAGLSAF